jgi:glucose 1-dehydrogenase
MTLNHSNQEKRTVLITGAAGGIGRATVNLFSECGWRVIGVDRAAYGEPFPAAGLFVQADIAQPEQLDTIFAQAHAFSPSLDALINNAAYQIIKPILQTSAAEWDAVMASNLRSVFISAKLAHPFFLAAGGGAIVNVSSVHAIATSSNIAAYAASKCGMLALTRQCHPARRGRYTYAARSHGGRRCANPPGEPGAPHGERAHWPAS